MTSIDLTDLPIVDNHCHGLYRHQGPSDPQAWRRMFTESRDAAMVRDHVSNTVFYRRLIRDLATFLGCEPSEATVLAARWARGQDGLTGDLLRPARIETLIVDDGFPPADQVLSNAQLSRLTGCRVAPILRLETLMERLISTHSRLTEVTEAMGSALANLRGQGYVGLKSIAAYRSGLDIRVWPAADVEVAFREVRRELQEEGVVKLIHKPLLDTLLQFALAEAARQGVPVQFHVGYGDTDVDLRLGNPLHLRRVLERRQFRGLPIVLLHACYPYTREGGYLAAVYENVYLDLSYGIPFLSSSEMLAFTRAALGVAPISKLLYSSDGIGVPELYWSSALHGRRVLGQALGELVAQGELSRVEAEFAGAAVLAGNARQIYGPPVLDRG
jgi:uncharacterized protein